MGKFNKLYQDRISRNSMARQKVEGVQMKLPFYFRFLKGDVW
jgi:hypothetical protein